MTTPAKVSHAEAVLGCVNTLALTAALPLLTAAEVVIGAVTLRQLWLWFIVPTFHVAPLSFVAAAGLDATVSFLAPTRMLSAKEEARSGWSLLGHALYLTLFKAAYYLAIGAALHAWWPL